MPSLSLITVAIPGGRPMDRPRVALDGGAIS